jgi:predicted  nucleic acid-binding Zn-ribbon protein
MSVIVELTTVVAVSGLIGAISSIVAALAQRKKITEKDSLESKIKGLTSALSDSANLINHIQTEIESRHKLVEKLKTDHEHYESLVKLKESEVEAVAQLLRGELQKESKNSFVKSIAANFIFFVLGSAVSLGVAYYVS